MAVVHPKDIHPKGVLKYVTFKPKYCFRSMAIDEVDNKYWLIHDCGLWIEAEIKGDVVKFIAKMKV